MPGMSGVQASVQDRMKDEKLSVKTIRLIFVAMFCLTSAGSAWAEKAQFPSAEYIADMVKQSNASSCGYTLGVGGHGSVWGGHCNFSVMTMKSGSGLIIRPLSRFNVGRLADAKDGLFDPVWYNGTHFIWRLPLQAGIFRIYMGGGPWLGWRPSPESDPQKCYLPHRECKNMDKTFTITGGGFSGIEFFMRGRSYFLEIGAQGAANPNAMDGGLYFNVGSNFFFGD